MTRPPSGLAIQSQLRAIHELLGEDMCGIAGFVQTSRFPDSLETMLASMVSRGPDGAGAWRSRFAGWDVALGHRRLAIIDVAGGAQPMTDAASAATLTYNGEVYNFNDLRADLVERGHVFATHSDTEVVLHHLGEHGPAGLEDLNGMFALALWDDKTSTLLLARDRFGIKPLCFATLVDGGIAFASELSALASHPGVDRQVSRAGLVSYLFCDYVHPPHTMFEGVQKLAPGHYVIWRDGVLSAQTPFGPALKWFDPPGQPRRTARRLHEIGRQLWQHLDRAVGRHVVADVPVGVLLSGGLDSSCVATLAARHLTTRVRTFSIGFADAAYDESRHAAAMAQRIGARHFSEVLNASNLLQVLDAAVNRLDEPLADPSYLPSYLLAQLAARHVKVVLGGDGGDELWGGYPTYRAHLYARGYQALPEFLHRGAQACLPRLPVSDSYLNVWLKLRRFVGQWDPAWPRRHLRWMAGLDLPLLAQALRDSADVTPATFQALAGLADLSPLAGAMQLDLRTYLPGSVLAKVDRASMAHGLEVRPPFLDNELVAWSLAQPEWSKVGLWQGKLALRSAARPFLPAAILARPKKGFAVPLANWIRGPLQPRVRAALDNQLVWDATPLNHEAFAAWNDQHLRRRADFSKPLWALVILETWLRRQFTADKERRA